MANFKMLERVLQSLHSVPFLSGFYCHLLLTLGACMFTRGVLICSEAIDKAQDRQAEPSTLKSRRMSRVRTFSGPFQITATLAKLNRLALG